MFLVNPMPRMRHQRDLNCGWYCEKSLIDYWYQSQHGHHPRRVRLPKTTVYGYDPEDDAYPNIQGLITRTTKLAIGPGAQNWETGLAAHGPIIVSGKLGGAYWGTIRGHRLGVGHWVLVVGADSTVIPTQIYYKDPLYGDSLRHGNFNNFFGRMDTYVYYLDQNDAITLMARIGTG